MAQCLARSKRTGEQCRRYAVKAKTACYMHSGKSPGRPIVHGRYSHALKSHPEFLERYEYHKSDPALMETMNEIALQRALLDRYLTRHGALMDKDFVEQVRAFGETITKLVERRHKINSGQQITITVRHLEAFAARVLETVRTVYGDDERYSNLLAKLKGLIAQGD